MSLARIFITLGVGLGLAAPAQALMSTHALYQALIGAIFSGQTLSLTEILGILLGLIGVSMMAFVDTCVSKYQQKKEIQRLRESELQQLGSETNQAQNKEQTLEGNKANEI